MANGNFINIRHNQYGTAYSVNVNDASNLLNTVDFMSGVGINATPGMQTIAVCDAVPARVEAAKAEILSLIHI